MANKFESLISAKINQIETELNTLKALISTKKSNPISLSGKAKLLVGEEELAASIDEAKKSLSKGV